MAEPEGEGGRLAGVVVRRLNPLVDFLTVCAKGE